ncbi:aminomethyltransferase [Sinomonas cellulolyticus]|uniref:Aminomethyltransferase n=1 Tax=Sinomonas cellulolyticus TaxID=2801916 RepID=A0ABS1K0X0_9MICC|nr:MULTISPECIES: glycine cleavage system aminomethyltransferase GcvT [Sinomonas]MBL0705032.1 glycine cleavage system aminomethyltransferase GcvT [Sinomonas cellulolyticus]GHG53863.1 aminomethyltransferase [Sinomonas sp. KCTC 49339]
MTETTTTQTAQEKHTALYAEHEALGASFTDFGGWQMPLKYGSELAEHRAVREAAGLFDLSHMGEVWATGPGAAAFLDYALVGKLSAIAVGKAKYSLICAEDGGIIDDLIVYRVAEEDFLVVPNAGNAATVAGELASRLEAFTAADDGSAAGAVALRDASAETSLVAVQGPNAEAILLSVAGAEDHDDIRTLKYYAGIEATIAGVPVFLARTGYTGEDGFELFVGNELAVQLWKALEEAGKAHGLVPCGLASRDSLRLEAGMPLYGNELSRSRSPFAGGLGGVVALKSKEGDFVGRAALEAKKAEGEGTTSGQRLVGLKGLGRRAARSHYAITKDGVQVGEVTSGQPSPTLGYPVALAYVDVEHSAVGTKLDADLRGKAEPFEVVELPFYKRQK